MKWGLFYVLIGLSGFSVLYSQDTSLLDGKNTEKKYDNLNLSKAIDVALKENLSLVYERFDPETQAQNIEIAKSAFDAVLSLDIDASSNRDAAASSTLDGSPVPESDSLSYDLSLSKKFSTGATVALSTSMDRDSTNSTYSTLNPAYGSNFGLTVSQPLLKGGGTTVNLAPLALARSNKKQSELELRKKVLDTILATETAYWDLAAAYAFRQLRQSNLDLANKLLEENSQKFKVGLLRRQDVLQAQANLASEKEQIINADQLIAECTDAILTLMGELRFLENPNFNVASLPLDLPEIPDFRNTVDSAIGFDLDLQITMEIINRAQIDKNVTERNLNPTLDVSAGIYTKGKDSMYTDSYSEAFNIRGYNGVLGLEFSLPLGLREEYANDAKAAIALRKSQLDLAIVQQTLMTTLRTAFRNLVASSEKIKTAKVSLELNKESFKQQKALYDSGLCSFRDVLSAQSDLDTAQRSYLDALYEAVLNKAKLSRLDGTILTRHGFSWDILDNTQVSKNILK